MGLGVHGLGGRSGSGGASNVLQASTPKAQTAVQRANSMEIPNVAAWMDWPRSAPSQDGGAAIQTALLAKKTRKSVRCYSTWAETIPNCRVLPICSAAAWPRWTAMLLPTGSRTVHPESESFRRRSTEAGLGPRIAVAMARSKLPIWRKRWWGNSLFPGSTATGPMPLTSNRSMHRGVMRAPHFQHCTAELPATCQKFSAPHSLLKQCRSESLAASITFLHSLSSTRCSGLSPEVNAF